MSAGSGRQLARGTKSRLLAVTAVAGLVVGGLASVTFLSSGIAEATVSTDVPCSGPGGGAAGLTAAINNANADGGGTIDLAAGCTYAVTTGGVAPGEGGLPVVTRPITLNGNGATIAGEGSSWWSLCAWAVNVNLTLEGVTVTGGSPANTCSPRPSPPASPAPPSTLPTGTTTLPPGTTAPPSKPTGTTAPPSTLPTGTTAPPSTLPTGTTAPPSTLPTGTTAPPSPPRPPTTVAPTAPTKPSPPPSTAAAPPLPHPLHSLPGVIPALPPASTGSAAPAPAPSPPTPVVPAVKGAVPVGKGMWIWAPPRVPEAASTTSPPDTAPQPDVAIHTPSDFSRALLAALGDPNTGPNVQALDAWQAAEGGFIHLNPFNTTQPAPGSTIWNSVGVKTYPDWATAIRATAETLKNGQYRQILAALKAGTSAVAVAHAVGNSPWGTGDFTSDIGQQYAPTVNGTDLPAVDAMVAKAQAAGLSYVVVLLGSTDATFTHQSFLDAFLPAAHAANIRVYGADMPSLSDPKADAARAVSEITYTTPDQDRIDGFVADLDPAGGANPPLPAAQDYGNALRFAVGPDFPLVAAVPAPPVPAPPPPAAAYPYPQVVSPFDAIAVMDPSSSPASQDLAPGLAALAPLDKPVIAVDQTPALPPPHPIPTPTGTTLSDPAHDQMAGFIAAADDAKAISVSFWSWETASPSVFDALQSAPQFGLPVAPAAVSANQVRNWQTLLTGLGFPAPASGRWDAVTTAAIKAYQQAAAIPVTGTIDDTTRTTMLTPFPPPLPAALLASALADPAGVVGPGGAALPLPRQYLKNGSVDQGVDYSAPGGTPLYAMGSGTIIQEGIDGFGPDAPVLQITSGPLAGKTVYYGHAGRDVVPVGAHVVQGQQISVVGYGIVGVSTGPHLEVGFLPLGHMGAGQSMLDYLNAIAPSIGG